MDIISQVLLLNQTRPQLQQLLSGRKRKRRGRERLREKGVMAESLPHASMVKRKTEVQGKSTKAAGGGPVYLEAAGPGAAEQGSCTESRDRARFQSLPS